MSRAADVLLSPAPDGVDEQNGSGRTPFRIVTRGVVAAKGAALSQGIIWAHYHQPKRSKVERQFGVLQMAKTVDQIRQQIEKLQAQEQALLAKEVAGVVARIKEAIVYYNLTSEQLFGESLTDGLSTTTARSKGTSQRKAKVSTKAKAASQSKTGLKGIRIAIKYRDDQGNTWTGRGSQPRWLRSALENGKSLEDFSV